MTTNQFTITYDDKEARDGAIRYAKETQKAVLLNEVRKFFCDGKYGQAKGGGYKEIEEKLANQFLAPEFERALEYHFNTTWKSMFEEAVNKAMQHRLSAQGFKKTASLMDKFAEFLDQQKE